MDREHLDPGPFGHSVIVQLSLVVDNLRGRPLSSVQGPSLSWKLRVKHRLQFAERYVQYIPGTYERDCFAVVDVEVTCGARSKRLLLVSPHLGSEATLTRIPLVRTTCSMLLFGSRLTTHPLNQAQDVRSWMWDVGRATY